MIAWRLIRTHERSVVRERVLDERWTKTIVHGVSVKVEGW